MNGQRPGVRGRRREAGKRDARVVWPPQGRDSAREAIDAMLRERGLARGFDDAVLRAADRARARGPDPSFGEPRRDLTALATFTIDPASARDFDDAVSAERLPGGSVRVWVHIADVGAYVKQGSPVDLEARTRANSVYVPGSVEPMLPAALSNDACSLLPGRDRATVTTQLDLHGAEIQRAAFYRSVIRSDVRLDYERVDRIFAGAERAEDPWGAALADAREAAAALQRAREQRGSLAVDSQEPEFALDEQGNVIAIRARVQTEAHRLIEHLMIAANEAVARLLEQRRVPCLYRVHERPDPEAVARLVEQLASLEVPTPPMPQVLSPSQAHDVVAEAARLVEAHVRRTGRGRLALSSLVLRSLKQAYYSPRNLGHAGLRSQSYCHFTSPIRRYPDLVCHRALLSTVGGTERAHRPSELPELGSATSEREREAMAIERAADDIASCFLLEASLYEHGWEQVFAGEVVGLIGAGAFVAFGGPAAAAGSLAAPPPLAPGQELPGMHVHEGLLPARRLLAAPAQETDRSAQNVKRRAPQHARAEPQSDWWEPNELGTMLRGQRTDATVRLADELAVRVLRIDPPRGRADLVPAPEQAPG